MDKEKVEKIVTELTKEEPKEEKITEDDLLKRKTMEILNRIGSGGGMNTNELAALKELMKKNKFDMGGMMKMMMMSKMFKDDGSSKMSPMEMMMMMQMMGGSKDSDWQKKFEELESRMREEKKMNELKSEIGKLVETIKSKGGGDGLSLKDYMAMITEREKSNDKWRTETEKLRHEMLQNQIGGAIASVTEEVKKLKEGGGDLEKMSKTVDLIKKLSEQIGIGQKPPGKTGTELAKELVENVTKSLAPAINRGVEVMAERSSASSAQAAALRQLQTARPQVVQRPVQQVEAPSGDQPYTDSQGNMVYPSVIDISDRSSARRRSYE